MNFYRRNLVIYRVANLHDKHSINFLPSTCQCVNDWSNNFTLSYFNGRILLLKNIYNHLNGIKKWKVILNNEEIRIVVSHYLQEYKN